MKSLINMGSIALPENSTILLDTNFFIDLFEHESKYSDFFTTVESLDIALVSTLLVKGEFVRTKDRNKLFDKNILFSKIVSTLLKIDDQFDGLLTSIIEEYSYDIEGVNIIDLFLACFLKRYKRLYLLTRNHKDFPTKIFHRSHVFSIEHEKDVKTYALYQYMPKANKIDIEETPF